MADCEVDVELADLVLPELRPLVEDLERDRARWQARAEGASSLYETATRERDQALSDVESLRARCEAQMELLIFYQGLHGAVTRAELYCARATACGAILRAALVAGEDSDAAG